MRMPDRTPPQYRHIHGRMMRGNMKVRNIVVSVCGAFDSSRINAILNDEGSKRRASHDGLAHNDVTPCRRHAIRAHSNLDAVHVHRTIVAALHVVFAGPDEFHRSPGKTLRDRGCLTLDVRVRRRSSPESAAGHLRVKGDLIRFQTQDLGDRHLVHSLELRTGPYFRAIAVIPDGGVQGLHRAVSKIRELVFGNYPIAGGDACQRLFVTASHGNVARSASEFFVLFPQLRIVRPLYSGEVPINPEPIARLLGRPELVGNNGYRGPFADGGDLKYIRHSGNAPCRLVVDRSRRCAEGRRMRHQRNLHSGQIEIEPKFQGAVALGATVKPTNLLADQPEVSCVFERHCFGHRHVRRCIRQVGVLRGPPARAVNYAGFGTALVGRHLPLFRGRGNQHRACLGTEFPVLLKRVRDGTRAADHLDAEDRVFINVCGGRKFRQDLRPVSIHLIG